MFDLTGRGPSNNATRIETVTVTDKLLPSNCFLSSSSGLFDCAGQAGNYRTHARRKPLAGFAEKV